MNKTKISVSLTLIGDDFNVDYVTQKIGIPPNYIRHKNDILKNGQLFDHTEWGIEIGPEETLFLDDQLNILFAQIKEQSAKLKQVAREHNATWDLVIWSDIWDEKKPALGFSREQIHLMAELDIAVGFDIYWYDNEE